MFQSFDIPDHSAAAPAHLALLRAEMARRGLDAALIPRADIHQGENVASCDERLAWTTGFTGSAGLAAVTAQRAALFVDGRYTLQARAEAPEGLEIAALETGAAARWLGEALTAGGRVGVDPWLHGKAEIDRLRAALTPGEIALILLESNPIDAVWADRPDPPAAAIHPHPAHHAGEDSAAKRARIGAALRETGAEALCLSAPDSVAWLFNIRGADIARSPAPRAFALLHVGGEAVLFIEEDQADAALRAHLGAAVTLRPPGDLRAALAELGDSAVLLDKNAAPFGAAQALESAGARIVWDADPCIAAKARKNPAELAGMRAAHLRDGAAMARFLSWLDSAALSGELTEIDVVKKLEAIRADDPLLNDISFDTICGAGPHGAIVHYRVTRSTDRPVRAGDLLLIDSGGQYEDGTTDITRTLAIGAPEPEARRLFTLVLKGMIAVSRARFPEGTPGRDLDVLARAPLWAAGHDYAHGTGHGVGAALNVHEGPVTLSRRGTEALAPGMVLSNEPGCYLEGRFGIRIENLLIVSAPAETPGGAAPMMGFETLTWAPIDQALIDPALLTSPEREWLDAYHAQTLARIAPLVDAPTAAWLETACAPLG